ncbi:MAG: Hsp70 family protein [Pseudonocardia sp.]|nr:Hsp70 family protein [Pseudonocardia sp.]
MGIDLGTTHCVAAVCRAGASRPEIVPLDDGGAPFASVVHIGADGTLLAGEAAVRRALTDPTRVVREFTRRIGDPTPLLVGGRPVHAEEIAARVIAWIIDRIAEREGARPDSVTVTHPATWGRHRRDALAAALAAHHTGPVGLRSEPHAAAIGHARSAHLPVGAAVAVYDLGGGTFDASVLRVGAGGAHTILGRPTGIDRLGGVDFDQIVLDHVIAAIGPAWQRLDPADRATQSAVAALRRACTAAKEMLSAGAEAVIPVELPSLRTRVRLTRAEFEDMIRPALAETVETLRRAIADAGVAPEGLAAVLLAGGSSRIPLVERLLSAELGRPVAAEIDPYTVVAIGAALDGRSAAAPVADAPTLAHLPRPAPVPPPRPVVVPEIEVAHEPRPGSRRWAGRGLVVLAAAASLIGVLAFTSTVATSTLPLAGGGSPRVAIAAEPLPPRVDDRTGTRPGDPPPPDQQAVIATTPPVASTAPTRTGDATPAVPAGGTSSGGTTTVTTTAPPPDTGTTTAPGTGSSTPPPSEPSTPPSEPSTPPSEPSTPPSDTGTPPTSSGAP